jgi:hypothetical protein
MKCLFICCAVAFAPLVAADGLRDPTRPPALPANHAAVVREADPVLSAIIGTDGDRVAIFNGRPVRSGGSVGGYTIESVFEDGVRYRHAGSSRNLYLRRTASFKKPSTAAARDSVGVH